MTTAKILTKYANEDLNILIENGSFAMTDTAYKTVIWFEYENKTFTAKNSDGVTMMKTPRKALMRDFIKTCFIID